MLIVDNTFLWYTYFTMFILGLSVGIVTGVLLSIANQLLFLRIRPQVERTEKQIISALKEKGEIITNNVEEVAKLLDAKEV